MDQKLKAQNILKDLITFINRSDINISSMALRDIISAIRGPDDENDKLKAYTTARLRSFIGLKETSCLFSLPASLPSVQQIRKKFPHCSKHFLFHYEKALQALKLLDML